jgi:hypothetical protein
MELFVLSVSALVLAGFILLLILRANKASTVLEEDQSALAPYKVEPPEQLAVKAPRKARTPKPVVEVVVPVTAVKTKIVKKAVVTAPAVKAKSTRSKKI